MIIYPKILKNLEKLSAFFGISYGKEFQKIIAREPAFTYMAFLTQAGTNAPVPEILFNNFDNDPVFEYMTQGTYNVIHPLFKVNKTIVTIEPGSVLNPLEFQALVTPILYDGNFKLITSSLDGTILSDDVLVNSLIKIEIWL